MAAAENLLANLENYKLQFQQVEAALTTDPDSEDLQKLKDDLQEVIDLTEDLIKQQDVDVAADAIPVFGDNEADDGETNITHFSVTHRWNVGDKCTAVWSSDGFSYEATIDEILEDGTCTLTFTDYSDVTEIVALSSLKPIEGEEKSEADGQDGSVPKKMKKKDWIAQQREYKRKKSQKKAQRQKQLDEEREHDKNKWINFHTKVTKGKSKKSIFASPETDSGKGRVGVGTCGVSGQPMTQYSTQKKWRK